MPIISEQNIDQNLQEISLDDLKTELQTIEYASFDEIESIITNYDIKPYINKVEKVLDDSLIFKIVNNANLQSNEKIKLITELVSKGANVELKDNNTSYPLIHYLITLADIYPDLNYNEFIPQIIEKLVLANEELLNSKNNELTPIAKAVEIGNADIVDVLLKSGANPNDLMGHSESLITGKAVSLLEEALRQISQPDSRENAIKIVKLLIEHKVNISRNIVVTLRKELVDHPLLKDPAIRDFKLNYDDHKKLLEYAVSKNEPDILPDLKLFGSLYLEEIIKKDKNKTTDIIENFIKEEKQKALDFRKFLCGSVALEDIDNQIKTEKPWLNVQNDLQWNTLFSEVCSQLEKKELIKLLLQYGANPNITNTTATNCLSQATHYNHTDTIKLLLDHGADVNINNGAPLKSAIYNNNPTIVELLLKNGANPNYYDDTHYRSAVYQIKSLNEKIQGILVECKNNIDLLTEGKRVKYELNQQKLRNSKAIINLLLDYGAKPGNRDLNDDLEKALIVKVPLITRIKSYVKRQDIFKEYYAFKDHVKAYRKAESAVNKKFYHAENPNIFRKMLANHQGNFQLYLPDNSLYKYVSEDKIADYKELFEAQFDRFNNDQIAIGRAGRLLISICNIVAKNTIYSELLYTHVKTHYAIETLNSKLSLPEDAYRKALTDQIKEEKNKKPLFVTILSSPVLQKLLATYLRMKNNKKHVNETALESVVEDSANIVEAANIAKPRSWVERINFKIEALAFGDIDSFLERTNHSRVSTVKTRQ